MVKYDGWDKERGVEMGVGGLGHSLGSEWPTYKILAFYRAKNPLKSEVRIKSPPVEWVKVDAYGGGGRGIYF